MSIYRARLRNTSNALSPRVSSEQIRLQVPPKLFGVDSWIPHLISLIAWQGRLSPNSHDATLPPPFSPLRSPTFSSPLFPFFTGVRGHDPIKNFGIKDARRRVLEHFGHENQHLYEPGFSTVSCNFRISSKCACDIVNR